ncbi:NmrA domain-containing protein [Mycena chlorophos]|uniref:NmrA domain-containing protein n=1 Tax=Mycena chlorophos TaxID=658473 RepID=A0A8H6S2X2_MYCCL|nr:NmrA domain-containing protein [Mycena chlorophos]
MSPKTVLVTGATGHQGRALIRALLEKESDSEFHVLALTRSASSPAAQRLCSAYGDRVRVVEGDLDAPAGIRRIFDDAKTMGDGIWGVFCVLAFPGLGANADGEEAQGTMLTDLSFECGVSHFIFSSSDRGGEYYDDEMKTLDRVAKIRIERRVKELGAKGLSWTIFRPGFFMENYDGFIGAIAVGVLKAGLKPTTTNRMVAVEDIGYVAAAVFRNPTQYAGQIITISDQVTTMEEQQAQYRAATGRNLPSIPWFLAMLIIMMNGHTKELLADIERIHQARETGLCAEVVAQAETARAAYPEMRSLQQWAESRKAGTAQRGEKWNQISLWALITGKH